MFDGQQLVLESMHRPGHVIMQDSQVISSATTLAWTWLMLRSAFCLCLQRLVAFANSVDPLEQL